MEEDSRGDDSRLIYEMFCYSVITLSLITSLLSSLYSLGDGVVQSLLEDYDSNAAFKLPDGITLHDKQEFDYVVVGAGAGGSAVASRLALAGFDVLLVEAGGDPGILTRIPSTAMTLLGSPVDWKYQTVPNDKSCLASEGKQCRFSRGKCLGGSTSINYMLYTRGGRNSYNYDVPGWTWEDIKPYFLKYEGLKVLDKFPESSRPYHNTTGLKSLEFFADPGNKWHSRLVRGFKQLHFPFNPDVNGISSIGVTQSVGYVYQGERMSSARAYLSQDAVKATLKIAKLTYCTGVIIDETKTARGVILIQEPSVSNITVYARKHVILSAGTIGNPQILLSSGIGPADHLKEMGKPVLSDLPVGENMTDHVLPLIILLVDKSKGITETLSTAASKIDEAVQLIMSKRGPLASNGLTDITAFANTECYDFEQGSLKNNSSKCESADVQFIFAYINRGLVSLAKPIFKQAINFNDDITEQIAIKNKEYSLIVVSPVVLKPFSKGKVRLSSSDPLDPPAIFANYLDDSRDVAQMMRFVAILEDLLKTSPFKKNNAKIFHLGFPKCPKVETDKLGYWECYARHMTFAVYHAVGTCALGSVVDPKLRVKGINNLSIADISVLPKLPTGNTAAAAIAIGERLFDFLME
ncbi:hypothetical protein K1T71_007539 [Dendrolimus kikuchii]|uniref:Uncharacterized protein n=1 Tax=Dendrolimus kikuchii TaxID=765133 RepID=A0ACC1CY06_9NEOP|nr:hypothetical protein K1T71_007539 [Dendrolimus kikuchii]